MITDLTIDSLAQLMIEKYGEEASFTAVERSRVLRDCGDGQSSRAWLSVSRRIDKIAATLPKSTSKPLPDELLNAASGILEDGIPLEAPAKPTDEPELV